MSISITLEFDPFFQRWNGGVVVGGEHLYVYRMADSEQSAHERCLEWLFRRGAENIRSSDPTRPGVNH